LNLAGITRHNYFECADIDATMRDAVITWTALIVEHRRIESIWIKVWVTSVNGRAAG